MVCPISCGSSRMPRVTLEVTDEQLQALVNALEHVRMEATTPVAAAAGAHVPVAGGGPNIECKGLNRRQERCEMWSKRRDQRASIRGTGYCTFHQSQR